MAGPSGSPPLGPTVPQTAAAQANTAAIAAPTVGDIIVVMGRRIGSTTPPTKATGYTTIDATVGANANSAILGFKISDGTETDCGTWTNANSVAVAVLRTSALGMWAVSRDAGSSTNLNYKTLSMAFTDGTSFVLGFGASVTATNVGQAPTGMTLKASANDIAVSVTSAAVSAWSNQAVTVNQNAAWISYTLEFLAVPAGQTRFTLKQFPSGTGVASGSTATVALTQDIGPEPHLLLFDAQFTGVAYPMLSSDKAGTLIPIAAHQGADPNGAGCCQGYMINTTTASGTITLTFGGAISNCNLAMFEFAWHGTIPALDTAATAYNNSASTTLPGPDMTISSAIVALFGSLATSNNTLTCANPYNAPTGKTIVTSGNLWSMAVNQASGAGPNYTIDAAGTSRMSASAFGASPTAKTLGMFASFDGGANNTACTETLLKAGVLGLAGQWSVNGTAMKFQSTGATGLQTAFGPLSDGKTAAIGGGSTFCVEYLSSTGDGFLKCAFFPNFSTDGFVQKIWAAGIYFATDWANADASNIDIFTLTAGNGANFVNIKHNSSGAQRQLQMEVGAGGSGSGAVIVPNISTKKLWLTLNFDGNVAGVMGIGVYDVTGGQAPALIGNAAGVSNGAGSVANVVFGQLKVGAAPTSGFYQRFSGLKLVQTASVLMP